VPVPIYGCSTPPGGACTDNEHCYTLACENGFCALGEGGAGGMAGDGGSGGDPGGNGGEPSGGTSGGSGTAGGGTAGTGTSGGGNAGTGTSGGGSFSAGTSSGGTAGAIAGAAPGGSAQGGAPSAGSSHGVAGEAGGPAVECLQDSDCDPGLFCNRDANVCVDRGVIACGCRVAGGERSSPAAGWLGLLGLGLLRLRRRRHSLAQR
jgi:MYXO-CTERM domain-containing protein